MGIKLCSPSKAIPSETSEGYFRDSLRLPLISSAFFLSSSVTVTVDDPAGVTLAVCPGRQPLNKPMRKEVPSKGEVELGFWKLLQGVNLYSTF